MSSGPRGAVGVSDHAGWAVLVSVDGQGAFVDRRRVELVATGVPVMPYHHDAQGLPPDEAVALVERVTRAAARGAAAVLARLADDVPAVRVIALRQRPTLPATIAERLADYRAQNVADWVMYREALAAAAEARGWSVHWYDAKRILDDASVKDRVGRTGRPPGPPWQKDHQLAMAAALEARG